MDREFVEEQICTFFFSKGGGVGGPFGPPAAPAKKHVWGPVAFSVFLFLCRRSVHHLHKSACLWLLVLATQAEARLQEQLETVGALQKQLNDAQVRR